LAGKSTNYEYVHLHGKTIEPNCVFPAIHEAISKVLDLWDTRSNRFGLMLRVGDFPHEEVKAAWGMFHPWVTGISFFSIHRYMYIIIYNYIQLYNYI
jgi:hypothetical protein